LNATWYQAETAAKRHEEILDMKVVLRADVENLGHLGDVVAVRAGYGRNFLLPQGLAMPATPANLKTFELERKKLQARMDALRSAAAGTASLLEGRVVRIEMRVGENDKLYGSVTAALICDALRAEGVEVDRRRILLDAPIRTLGEHLVRVRLHAGVTASLTVAVAPEGRHDADEAKAEPDAGGRETESATAGTPPHASL
jgi:large subunit ribosomal protein L9